MQIYFKKRSLQITIDRKNLGKVLCKNIHELANICYKMMVMVMVLNFWFLSEEHHSTMAFLAKKKKAFEVSY